MANIQALRDMGVEGSTSITNKLDSNLKNQKEQYCMWQYSQENCTQGTDFNFCRRRVLNWIYFLGFKERKGILLSWTNSIC
ncbi:BI1-like protein [Iris pallida]|uniref:BI1-like protein n=1 Tax=Iris pallida TaxID=29817 RepID=A0AAX6ECD6_IRIPA|nr:BI1-like protein [Iris pallida]